LAGRREAPFAEGAAKIRPGPEPLHPRAIDRAEAGAAPLRDASPTLTEPRGEAVVVDLEDILTRRPAVAPA
jgi:hypothetical protein